MHVSSHDTEFHIALAQTQLPRPQEYAKAVSLMRVVVEGRGAPGAVHAASPGSVASVVPLNRLLHLRVVVALEEKAAVDESGGAGWGGLGGWVGWWDGMGLACALASDFL